jgi:tetratricopeptide (TPR) repeat protein
MRSWLWKSAAVLGLAAATLLTGQQDHQAHDFPVVPLAEKTGPLRKALLLLREGKTAEARIELEVQRRARPNDAEVLYQIARSYLMDFYQADDPEKRRVSLALAMEMLDGTLQRNPDHIPALRAKAVIHARAELLYYNPNLAYDLANRVAKLEPHANGFLLDMSSWMSGEVRFTKEGGHRVPHDPLIGIDRSIDMLETVLDDSMPFSTDESSALVLMGNAHSRRGNFPEAASFYKQALTRNLAPAQKLEVLRELGASYYRMGDFSQAAHDFYEALQVRVNLVDEWLLRVATDRMTGAPPALPESVRFPVNEPAIDPANPPLLQFEDIAPKVGIHSLHGNGTVAWGDIDGDGKLDVIVSGSGTFIKVYRNEGGKFADVTEKVGLGGVPSGYSLNLVDYDNDGWLDLFISLNGWNGPMPDRLFHNERGHYVDVSKKSGLDDAGSGFVSLWGDLDNDGWLDVVIANGVLKEGSVPQIYRNNRDGTFTNMTKAAGIDEPAAFGTIGAALGDYDKDGRLDILFNGLDPAPNRLYRNDGNWHFTEVAKKAGVAQGPHNGYVCFFVDYNNDGWPDILTTSLAPWESTVEALRKGFAPLNARAVHRDSNRLYRNNRDGTFSDVTFDAKLYYPMGTMGAGVADLDNDGYVDFYFGTGDPQMSRLEPNRFFRNNGNGTFSDLTRYVNFARPGNKGHGVAFVDLDGNGALDIFAQLGGHYPGDHAYDALYHNLKASQNHWLEVDLRGVKSNRFGVGAQLTAKAGDLIVYREVKGSEGFGATNPYRQHFGFGKRGKIDSLEIRWPSGVRQVFGDVGVNRVVEVREDAGEVPSPAKR